MLKKLKNDKKGFTLVELIVVLVILAILAALLVPALTGYIDKAKEKSIIAETRSVVMAAQTLADEAYGTLDVGEEDGISFSKESAIKFSDVTTLAEVTGTIESINVSTGKITKVVYKNKNKTCTYHAAGTSEGEGSSIVDYSTATYDVE